MTNFNEFSNRLKELRTSKNMTQKQFADLVGTTSVTLSAYENNTKKPSLDIVKKIAEKCKVSIDWLCGLSDMQNRESEPYKVETYSDFIQFIFKLEETNLAIRLNSFTHSPETDACEIGFHDYIIKFLLTSWVKTGALYKDGTIDETIYTAWKEKIVKDFDTKLLAEPDRYSEFRRILLDYESLTEYDRIKTALDDLKELESDPDLANTVAHSLRGIKTDMKI